MIFGNRQTAQLTEYRRRRRTDQLAYAGAARSFEHPNRTQHVDFGIVDRLLDRAHVSDRSSEMKNDLGSVRRTLHGRFIAYVRLDETHLRKLIQIFSIAGGEIVDDGNVVSLIEEQLHDV